MSKYIDIINKGMVHNLKTNYEQNYVDTMQVVRCKDCRYNYANLIPNGSGCSNNVELKAEAEWYCADGERDE